MANESYGSIIHNGVNYSLGDGANSAKKSDIVELQLSGTTNTSGSTITAGTWFYLNGEIVKAKVDIASNATFTLNTNYEKKTIGAELAELNSNSGWNPTLIYNATSFLTAADISYTSSADSVQFSDQNKGADVPLGDYMLIIVCKVTGVNVRISAYNQSTFVTSSTYFKNQINTYVTLFDNINKISWDYSSGGTSNIYDLRLYKMS